MLAYLDANSGSLIAAAVAGGTAGLMVLVRMYRYRVLGIVSKKYRAKAEEQRSALIGED